MNREERSLAHTMSTEVLVIQVGSHIKPAADRWSFAAEMRQVHIFTRRLITVRADTREASPAAIQWGSSRSQHRNSLGVTSSRG